MSGDADDHDEDHHVDQALEILPVVHGAHAGDESQHRGSRRIRPACGRRDEWIGHVLPCRPARFAKNLPPRAVAHAACAKRLSAVLAKGCGGYTAMIYAIHTVLLPLPLAEPPGCAGRLCESDVSK